MRVLLVSHTVISKTGNMGRTFLSYFQCFQPNEVAQFYIHSEIPTDASVCAEYYRFTDFDALKSIFLFPHKGKYFNIDNIRQDVDFSRIDNGIAKEIYNQGSKRTAAIYSARNLLWKLSHWFSSDLKKWLDSVRPDVIFFASGDYAFMYDVALKISRYTKAPLVTVCVDEFYFYNKNSDSLLGRAEHSIFCRKFEKIIRNSRLVLCICKELSDLYEKTFNVPSDIIYTSATAKKLDYKKDANRISYIGNLGYNRNLQLVSIGRAVKALHEKNDYIPGYIDVYSGEKRENILNCLTEENGIRFHGQISSDAVISVMEESMAVIHTESFDEVNRNLVRYSLSTKIAESLMYGPCLIAYGPEDVASIKYLKENNAAYVITDFEQLKTGLKKIISDRKLRESVIQNARKLAYKNHLSDVNSLKLRETLLKVINDEL